MQVELGFGNSIVNDIFYAPGYDVRGFVVAQVNSPLGNNTHSDSSILFSEKFTLASMIFFFLRSL